MPQWGKVLSELKEKLKYFAASRYLNRSPLALVLCSPTGFGDQHNLFICNKRDPQDPLLAGQHRGKKRATDKLSIVSSTIQQGQSRSFFEQHESLQPPICKFSKIPRFDVLSLQSGGLP